MSTDRKIPRLARTWIAGGVIAAVAAIPAVASPAAAATGPSAPTPQGPSPLHLVGGTPPIGPLRPAPVPSQTAPTADSEHLSTNWSGQVVEAGSYTQVSATWTVPAVQSSTSAKYSSTWIGIDGATNSDLIQTGVTEQTASGSTTYSPWWEILPASSTRITEPVAPGDVVSATITKQPSGKWKVTLTDTTKGWTFSSTMTYTGPGADAEWIDEAPTVGGSQSSMANYGTVTFSQLKANGSAPTAGSFATMYFEETAKITSYPTAFDAATDIQTIDYGTPTPTVTSVSPSTGPIAGGTAVSVQGTYLIPGTVQGVRFGTSTGTSVSTSSAGVVTASSPTALSGVVVDVTVKTTSGTTAATSADQFTYIAPIPQVTSVSPSTGTTLGGTFVTITGTNMAAAEQVHFGTSSAGILATSSTSVRVTNPAGSAGTVDVTVTNAYGTSTTSATDRYTYVTPPPPSVTGISPQSGPTAGGTSVVLSGADFTGATAVDFGAQAAVFSVTSTTRITATAPSGTGSVYVEVTTPSGTSPATATAQFTYETPPSSTATTGSHTPTPASAQGYHEVASDGGMFTFGNATFHGSEGGHLLNAPIVSMATDPATGGYWEVASDGGIFAFTAPFLGSEGGHPLNEPIVGMAATPTGGGYWEVASDGGIFTFGNAGFYGSMGGHPLNKPIVGMAATPTGHGYWEVASDGGIFSFGTAQFHGSEGGHPLNKPIVGMAADPPTGGYWEVASDGGIFAFTAPFLGSEGGHPLNEPIVSMAATPTGGGYWEVASDGGIFTFGNAGFYGSMGGHPLNKPVVGMAAT